MTQSSLRALSAGQTFEYRVRAFNGSEESENKIHEDSVAKQYGFRGGLVPGVTDYAYMTRPALDAFGVEWLQRGAMTARFTRPLYHGEMVTARASAVDAQTLELAALNEQGELCAPGTATLAASTPPAPSIDDFPWRELPDRDDRLPADAETLAVGTVLGSVDRPFTLDVAAAFAAEVPDDHAAYDDLDQVAHPGYLIRAANEVLHRTVRLGPWIHVESETQHFGLVHLGDQLTTRALVTGLFERKGHHFVVLDVATFAGADRAIQRVRHTAIYKLRPPGG